MHYAILESDIGQGAGAVAVPVAHSRPQQDVDMSRPHSVAEVLQTFYEEDFGTILENYVKKEQVEIQAEGVLVNADRIKVRMWTYMKTMSKLRQPVEETVVDVVLRGRLEGEYKDNTARAEDVDFRLRYVLDLRPCHQLCYGPLVWVYKDWENDPALSKYTINTNDYLLPILYNEDYEKVAHDMIETYFPEANRAVGGDVAVVDGEELAKRMGLRVINVRFVDKTVMGQLYYNFGEAQLIDHRGEKYTQHIRPGTILVNEDNCTSPAIRNSTIGHECCHMYLDRWFFLLQMMTGTNYVPYSSRRKENRKFYHKNSALDWMELQCEKLPAYLLMERDSTIAYIEECLKQCEWKRTPENIRRIIEGLAQRCEVSFQMAKYRMIELGYFEASGIRNYVNDAFVPDHGCTWHWPEKTTYTISSQDAARLAESDVKFEKLLCNGMYRYVEGHFCLNDGKYLIFDNAGKPHLTFYARHHIEECCLGFEVGGRYRKTAYSAGQAARNKVTPVTDKYRAAYKLVAEPGTAEYEKENQQMVDDGLLWLDLYKNRPADFSEAVAEIMKKKGITRENLALEIGVDRRAIYRYLNEEEPSAAHVVGICVALKLPYYVSMDILDLAGIRLRATELHFIYRQFLLNAENLSVSRCEDTLAKRGLPPLFRGQTEN